MLVVVSDTHGTEDHRLTGRTREAVRDADRVIHAGDFNTEAVYESFRAVNGSLRGVYGNNDDDALRERLPEVRTVDYGGLRFAVVHTRRGGATELTLLGRERDADAVIFGHSHHPEFVDEGPVPLLNPGSHAQPRRYRAAHAELEAPDGIDDPAAPPRLRGRLRTPEGETLGSFEVAGRTADGT